MRLVLVAVGRLGAGPERDLLLRYLERAAPLASRLGFSGPDEIEIADGRSARPEARRADEARAIRARTADSAVIALDEHGRSLPSPELAETLRSWRDDGRARVAFVIGGQDGLDGSVRDGAALTLAFGRQTWPHKLVRVLAAEQLYRALTILAGHPYHRE